VQTVLELAGSQVTVATNVADAMVAFTRHLPQVVLSDIGVPEHDGLELIRRIRAFPPEKVGECRPQR